MTVESATYIGQLSPTYPTGSDAKSEGDSHLRLIKSVLQAQFTSLGNAPVTATAAQINALVSASGLLSVGTSTTSNTIGTGSKTFTTQTGLGFAAGQAVRIQDNASLSNYMLGTISSYNTSTGALVVSVTDTAGSGTISDWSISLNVLRPQMTRRAITTTDTLANSDWGGFVDITSGTFTLSCSAVATLGSGFWAIVRNSGTGDVTIDPNGSETIDGLTSFVMYPGESRLVQCNGSALYSVVLSGFYKTFTASGTFTKPPGYKAFEGLLWGGGASGGKGDGSNQAGGGGGGACYRFSIPAANVSTTETVTIATGGTAVTTAATAGNSGGNSSFGSNIVSYGGVGSSITGGGGGGLKAAGSTSTGGTPADGFNGGGNGGNSSAGSSSFWGGGGGSGGSTDAAYAGGASVWGGGGGGNGPVTTAGAGGASTFGGAGGAGGTSGNGTAGTAPGGGGGATKTGTSSGAGARGELRIWGVV